MQDKIKAFLKSLRLNESSLSMVLGGLVVVVVGILVYNYFSSVNRGSMEASPSPEYQVSLVEEAGELVPDQLPVTHKVTAGEHLWSIAEKYYHSGYNWVDIASANGLLNANVVTEGQELTIPRIAVKPATVAATTPEVTGEATMEATSPDMLTATNYTVVKGDNLWNISVRAYADGYQWTRVWQQNSRVIVNPDQIEVGTQLTLPR